MTVLDEFSKNEKKFDKKNNIFKYKDFILLNN